MATEPSPTSPRTPSPLRKDIVGGLTIAFGLSIIALSVMVIGGIAALVGLAKFRDWSSLLRGLPLIIAGYFAAGFLGGIAFWALRPLRRWVVGWALTGAVLGTITYGAVGLSGVLGYVYFGVNILEFRSPREAWTSLPWISCGIGVLVGVPVGIYYWFQNRSSVRDGAV